MPIQIKSLNLSRKRDIPTYDMPVKKSSKSAKFETRFFTGACVIRCVVKQLFIEDHQESAISLAHRQKNTIGEKGRKTRLVKTFLKKHDW